ncbi:MAG: hypothetical protein QOH61_222 [Chloroflexota bacterium]|nr:hypothetical protein [Chloroflexota bacterium]
MDRSAAPRPGWARLAAALVPLCLVPDAVAVAGLGLWALSVWLVELAGVRGTASGPLALLLFGVLGIVWIVVGCLAGAALFFAYEEAVHHWPVGLAVLGVVGQPAAVAAWQVTGTAAWLLALVVLPAVLCLPRGFSGFPGHGGTVAHGR